VLAGSEAACLQVPVSAWRTSHLARIAQAGLAVRVVTLDTGRLFEDNAHSATPDAQGYGIPIDVFFPERQRLRRLIASADPKTDSAIRSRIVSECCRGA